MADETKLLIYSLIWVVLVAVVIIRSFDSKNLQSGLTVNYVISLTLVHFFGAVIYTFPWYVSASYKLTDTSVGFRNSLLGLASFSLGALVLAPIILRLFFLKESQIRVNTNLSKENYKIPKMLFILGFLYYLILAPVFGKIPSLGALLSAGQLLIVIGLCLICFHSWAIEKNPKDFWKWFLISLIFPFLTIVNQGFLGYGISMTLIVVVFVGIIYRPKWKVILFAVIVAYTGLSFYQGYIRDRSEIREVVWGGESYINRISTLGKTISKTELFNPFDNKHLERIDLRLNQNYLVGRAVENLQFSKNYAYGETIKDSFLAVVPRAIWPEKPVRAGSSEIVSEYTGLRFAHGTSVGVGQVMELYINLGYLGIIIGFLIIGVFVNIIDYFAAYNLYTLNFKRFALIFTPGLAILQVGGSFVEVVASAGAAFVITFISLLIPASAYSTTILSFLGLIVLFFLREYYLPLVNPIFNYLILITFLLIALMFLYRIIKLKQRG